MLPSLPVTLAAFAASLIACVANPVYLADQQCKISASISQTPYKSTNITNPELIVDSISEDVAPGYLFFVQKGINYITTSAGRLVWASPDARDTSAFRKQTLNGIDVLTYWTGEGNAATETQAAHGYGKVVILDSQYKPIHEVCLRLPGFVSPTAAELVCQIDVHESQMTNDGTILLTAYNITEADLSILGGPRDGYVFNSMVVEVDVATGEILWMWSPLQHIPVTATKLTWSNDNAFQGNGTKAAPFDYLHVNSAQKWGDDVLINARHTAASYLVNKAGDIIWQFNGIDGGDFGPLPDNTGFEWQHYAQLHPTKDKTKVLYTNFANNNFEPRTIGSPSHAYVFTLTLPPNKATPVELTADFFDPAHEIFSFAGGSSTYLGNGRNIVGYGVLGHIKEFKAAATGPPTMQMSITLGSHNKTLDSYRAFKDTWYGAPDYPPSLVIVPLSSSEHEGCGSMGYVSWNGATNVTGWDVLVGQSVDDMTQVASIDHVGFETEFSIPTNTGCVQVRAIGCSGASAVVPL